MKNAKEMARSIRKTEWGSSIVEDLYVATNAMEPEKLIGSKKQQERKEMDLKEGEVICNRCNGSGAIKNSKENRSFMDYTCPNCDGEGKTDWITNTIERPQKDFDLTTYLTDEIAKNINNAIDRNVFDKLYNTTPVRIKSHDDIADMYTYDFKSIIKGGCES